MASISSLGIGSNLDLSSLLTQLKSAESQPLVALQQRQISYTAKLSAYGMLQGALSGLQSAAKKLSDTAFFQGVKTTSAAADVLTASGSTTAAAGTYAVNVTQIAQAQSLVATGLASAKTAIGGGTLSISFGTIAGGSYDASSGQYAGASFTADTARTPVSITLDSTNNTLEGIRDAINQAKAGVSASIVNDGSGTPYRLVLTSTETGKASSMKLSVTGDAALSNLLGQDPAGTQNLRQTLAATNTELTVNGIAVTSKGSAVQDAIQGVTLNAIKTGSSTVTVQRDTGSVESAINDFVKAYNSLQGTAKSLSAYDTSKQSGGALVGDSVLRNLQVGIRNTLTSAQSGTGGAYSMLSQIGVEFEKDGTLSVDSTKLKAALAGDMDSVARLFSSAAGGTSGYGKQLDKQIEAMSSAGGSIKAAKDGLDSSLKQLDKQYAAMQDRVDAKIAHYRTQFSQLDLLVSNMNSTSSYLTQQFANMNASTKK